MFFGKFFLKILSSKSWILILKPNSLSLFFILINFQLLIPFDFWNYKIKVHKIRGPTVAEMFMSAISSERLPIQLSKFLSFPGVLDQGWAPPGWYKVNGSMSA